MVGDRINSLLFGSSPRLVLWQVWKTGRGIIDLRFKFLQDQQIGKKLRNRPAAGKHFLLAESFKLFTEYHEWINLLSHRGHVIDERTVESKKRFLFLSKNTRIIDNALNNSQKASSKTLWNKWRNGGFVPRLQTTKGILRTRSWFSVKRKQRRNYLFRWWTSFQNGWQSNVWIETLPSSWSI